MNIFMYDLQQIFWIDAVKTRCRRRHGRYKMPDIPSTHDYNFLFKNHLGGWEYWMEKSAG